MKKRISVLAFILVITLTCGGCNTARPESNDASSSATVSSETSPSLQNTPDTTPASSPSTLTEDEAESLRITTAGKQFAEELQNGVQPSNARDESVDNAVAAFERFFKLDTLYVSKVSIASNTEDDYICVISGLNQLNNAQSVRIIFSRSEPMTWYCSFVKYSADIDRVLEIYLGYLRDNDPDGLATWLNEGESPNDNTIESAKNTVAYFREHYDLSETSVREADTSFVESNAYSNEGFVFTIEDATGNTFQVELDCSDGLCYPLLLEKGQLD